MKVLGSFFLVLFSLQISAQEIAMADQMRESGKIYVVVSVLLIILLGILFYLVSLDRKLKRMEQDMQEQSSDK